MVGFISMFLISFACVVFTRVNSIPSALSEVNRSNFISFERLIFEVLFKLFEHFIHQSIDIDSYSEETFNIKYSPYSFANKEPENKKIIY